MTTNIDLGGNVLYVSDIYVNDNTPGSLTGTSVYTQLTESAAVDATSATLALTAAQSGTTVALDRAAGVTVTLPTPALGLKYTFIVATVPTSNKHKIITGTPTSQFLAGGVFFDKSLTITRYDGDGSTAVSLNLNGTTTGGLSIGDKVTFTGVSSTIWSVDGIVTASGTLATPFATS